jgi:hypothetical protein
VVGIVRSFIPKPDGKTDVQLQLNMLEAPTPARRYAAETAMVEVADDLVRLTFGQFGHSKKSLRTLLVVRMYPEAVRRLLTSSNDLTSAVTEFMGRNSLKAQVLPETVEEDPPHVVLVDSNVVAIGFSGREAEADFYHVTPMALRRTEQTQSNDLELDPVVRVSLPTTMLASVLALLYGLGDRLPKEAT